MRRTGMVILTCVLTLILCAGASAQARYGYPDEYGRGYGGRYGGTYGAAGNRMTDIMALMDGDNDGKLTGREVQRFASQLQGIRVRRDEYVSRDEVQRAIGAGRETGRYYEPQDRARQQVDVLMAMMDADGDGRVSRQELNKFANGLEGVRGGGDGSISRSDLEQGLTKAYGGTLPGGFGDSGRPRYYGSTPEQFIQRYDRNGDGEVSRREFTGSKEQFDRLDADNDGSIDRRDFRASGARWGDGADGSPALAIGQTIMRDYDTDNNGEVSKAEFQQHRETGRASFRNLDADNDGSITRQELERASGLSNGASRRAAEIYLQLYDADNDGKVSRDEYDDAFSVIDANNDGTITMQDFQTRRFQQRLGDRDYGGRYGYDSQYERNGEYLWPW